MNLLADEGVERQIIERLRQEGHAVVYIAELEPGLDDDVILRRANAAQALLMTADKDFGELVFRQRLIHSGVILVRLAGLLPETKARIMAEIVQSRGMDLMESLSVVSPGHVRIRKREP